MKYNKEKLNNSKGITLVALVIIVIILIILSGISINAVVGDGGIIAKAKLAKEESRASIVQDEADLWKAEKENAIDSGKPARTREEVLNKLVADGNLTPEVKIASRTIVFEPEEIKNKKFTIKTVNSERNSITSFNY